MKIDKAIVVAVDKVFTHRELEDKVYIGTIGCDELRQAAELVGRIKESISKHEKTKKQTSEKHTA